MAAMREAQKVFATYTQEQVDKIFAAAQAQQTRCVSRWQNGSRRDRNGYRRR